MFEITWAYISNLMAVDRYLIREKDAEQLVSGRNLSTGIRVRREKPQRKFLPLLIVKSIRV